MNKIKVQMRASWLQVRIPLVYLVGAIAAALLAQFIVLLSVPDSNNQQVSFANLLSISLIFLASFLPAGLFKRMINLGASRKEYYLGLMVTYVIWAAVLALLNVIWYKLDHSYLQSYVEAFNILEVFHWDQFGVIGMFFYQFGAYMVLISLLNLLFSGLKSVIGWLLWVVLIASIPVGTSIPSFRVHVADGFLALLFNDSLLQGLGLTLGLSCLFLLGGWGFTRRRLF